jgi:hypothetical protein
MPDAPNTPYKAQRCSAVEISKLINLLYCCFTAALLLLKGDLVKHRVSVG